MEGTREVRPPPQKGRAPWGTVSLERGNSGPVIRHQVEGLLALWAKRPGRARRLGNLTPPTPQLGRCPGESEGLLSREALGANQIVRVDLGRAWVKRPFRALRSFLA
jgi:hypothetical protein